MSGRKANRPSYYKKGIRNMNNRKVILIISNEVYEPQDLMESVIMSWLVAITDKKPDKNMVNKIWKAYTKNDWIDLIGIIEYTWDKWEEVKDLTPNQIAEKYIEDWQ
jgi:hypothetical protein